MDHDKCIKIESIFKLSSEDSEKNNLRVDQITNLQHNFIF